MSCRLYYCLLILSYSLSACNLLPVDLYSPPTLTPILTPIQATGETPAIIDTSIVAGFPTESATDIPLIIELTQITETQVISMTVEPAIIPTETSQTIEPPVPGPPTITPRPEPFFMLQQGNPQPLINIARPELGCTWMGVGGQIFNLSSEPVINLLVKIDGEINGVSISAIGLTGGAPQLGSGGYLLDLGDTPVESSGALKMYVLDLAGRVLSDVVYITTYPDCERNLVLVNFVQVKSESPYKIFLPVINRD